jgi:hypothetical protein
MVSLFPYPIMWKIIAQAAIMVISAIIDRKKKRKV